MLCKCESIIMISEVDIGLLGIFFFFFMEMAGLNLSIYFLG